VTTRPKLTRQQKIALLSFEGSVEGEKSSGQQCWEAGVRPWPTMSNLEDKGLCVYDEWWDENTGAIYSLTAAGAVERKLLAEEWWGPK
jgi:hypothetical protein